ncbi:HAD family hydrolase [Paenibacillus oceani]|uniref:HAD family hydrolase n=1 Tax=Paenibacillus oceani TaxID=2772510 RepID=A0A927H2Z5_9BACL|nr:HAD family hydrolase [Paenibacillus oceani]MBD2866761.1 HAD family hydrolase [Paenibacillus oceani]
MIGNTEAVLFDLFETLISEYEGGVRKVDRTGRNDAARLGLEHDVYRREWGARHRRRMTGEFSDYKAVMRHILEGQRATINEQELHKMYEERIAEKKAAFTGIDPEVIALLDKLKRDKIAIGLISNCTEEEVRGWQTSGLASYFDTVLFSYEANCAKPDPAIYLLACERLNVKPDQCLFIGDGGSDELNGASRAGMRACQAVWYLPESMREKTYGCPQLVRPMQVMQAVAGQLE